MISDDERRMPIEKVRISGILAFDEVSEISRWISDDVGFSKIGDELTKSSPENCSVACPFFKIPRKTRFSVFIVTI